MSHIQSVHSYPVVENSTLGWPISTTNFSPLNQIRIEEPEEKTTERKDEISSLEREKQSTEEVALQIQRSFLETYKTSDQLMDELVAENPSQVQVDRLIEERETLFDKLQGLLLIAQKNMSFDQIMEFIHRLEKDVKSNDQRMKELFNKSDNQIKKGLLHKVEKNVKLEKSVKIDGRFNDFLCTMSQEPTVPNMHALCENQKTRNIYLFDSAIEQFISDKIRIIVDKIDTLKKENKEGRNNPELPKKGSEKVRKLKTQIQKQEKARAEIQKTTAEIQKFLKESGFLSTGLIYHILSHSRLYREVNTLIQKRTSFRHSLLTQVEKIFPREKEEAIQKLLRKVAEEEPQARAIFRRKPIEACRDENHRMTLFHQLASEITRKSNQTITSINEKIKTLKERLKLLRAHPESESKPMESIKVLSTTALIGYGLGGVTALSMIMAIAGCVFWLKKKNLRHQNQGPSR